MKAKKLLSFFLALCLLVSLLPVGAVTAYASESENRAGSVSVPYHVNPLYADVLDVDDSNVCAVSVPVKTYGTATAVSASAIYVSESEAAEVLRQAMVNRETSVEIHYKTTNEDIAQTLVNVFNTAISHTGNPVEGDYLKFTYAGWGGGRYEYELSAETEEYLVSYTYPIAYYTTASQEAAVTSAVNSLLNRLNLYNSSDYQKLRGIYEYITEYVDYDYANLNNSSETLKYSAYSALINKTAVCQGYANLFYRLALELGVDARIISGIGVPSEGQSGLHAWNIAKLSGKYYNFDATWDDEATPVNFRYFLCHSNNFSGHNRDPEYTTAAFQSSYPMATSDYKVPSVAIASQPKSVTVAEGATASVKLTATGDGLTYKWYFKNPGSSKFSLTDSAKGNSYSVTMTEARAGRQVYCVVTDKYGNSVKSNTATLSMAETVNAVKITTQPKSVTVAEGATASVKLTATGDGLTYKWYLKNPGASKFSLTTSAKGNSYSVTMTEARAGRQVYCVVTDKYGNAVTSKTATLNML